MSNSPKKGLSFYFEFTWKITAQLSHMGHNLKTLLETQKKIICWPLQHLNSTLVECLTMDIYKKEKHNLELYVNLKKIVWKTKLEYFV